MGERRTGVAVSDPLGFTARPVSGIEHHDWPELVAKLRPWVVQYQPAEIVVGLPRRTDGRPGGTAMERVEAACEHIRKLGIPVVLWDERFTTVAAHQVLREGGVRGRRERQAVDAVAAAVLLQGYLDAQRMGSQRSDPATESGPTAQAGAMTQESPAQKEQQHEPGK